jgi:oxysterol-binding protein-related protein 9/10/11
MVSVLDWYLTLFHQIKKESSPTKPYNPILGETFQCSYKIDNNNRTDSSTVTSPFSNTTLNYTAEQVSHHPASEWSLKTANYYY